MQITFSNEVWYWRGPSPFYFLKVPEVESSKIKEVSRRLTYGWGVVPVDARIGEIEWTTSLIPKGGLYLLPLKNSVRFDAGIDSGDLVEAHLTLAI